MKKLKIILIHGNGGGTNQDHWFPWVKIELQKLDLKVLSPNFPDPIKARAKYWLPYLKNELKADKNTIIIGHSSGAVAALKYAEKNQLFGSILIGCNHTDLGDQFEKQSGYFNTPWQWSKIKQNQNWIIQFASIDDPYIPIKEPRFIHKKLNSDYHEYKDQGHFGSPDQSKKQFPEIIKIIKQKLPF